MSLKWTDTLDIAIELDEQHADVDPQYVDFDDDPEKSSERILEAIQMAWIDEKD